MSDNRIPPQGGSSTPGKRKAKKVKKADHDALADRVAALEEWRVIHDMDDAEREGAFDEGLYDEATLRAVEKRIQVELDIRKSSSSCSTFATGEKSGLIKAMNLVLELRGQPLPQEDDK